MNRLLPTEQDELVYPDSVSNIFRITDDIYSAATGLSGDVRYQVNISLFAWYVSGCCCANDIVCSVFRTSLVFVSPAPEAFKVSPRRDWHTFYLKAWHPNLRKAAIRI